jgi:hypothetical protein
MISLFAEALLVGGHVNCAPFRGDAVARSRALRPSATRAVVQSTMAFLYGWGTHGARNVSGRV